MRSLGPTFLILALAGCTAGARNAPAGDSSDAAADAPAPPSSSPAEPRAALPGAGLAMLDTLGRWCAAVATDSLTPGDRLTIVFPDSADPVTSTIARIALRRGAPCGTAFPQLSHEALVAYDLVMLDTAASAGGAMPSVGIAVASETRWRRDSDGVARADLDANGGDEEARVCAEGEGQHFSLWTTDPATRSRSRWWRAYFDWGAFVDPTCAPGDAG